MSITTLEDGKTRRDIYLSPTKPSRSKLTCSASLPATPLLDTHTFDSAYYLSRTLTSSFETLNLPDPGLYSDFSTYSDRWNRSHIQPAPSHSEFTMSDSSASLDVSLITDTSSMLDDSLPVGPSTPSIGHIHTQKLQSASKLLLGLGLAGLFSGDGKPFDGMGLLSEQCLNCKWGGGDDMIDSENGDNNGDAAADEDQDTGPSRRLLREVLVTFSSGVTPTLNHTDVFLASPERETAVFAIASSTSISGVNKPRPRQLSVSTISSQMKYLPKKSLNGDRAQKGRRVGPTWRP